KSVRQGKLFEIEVEGEPSIEEINKAAEILLSNPVIENYTVRVEK
ncbi:MAG: phosphoribosylformylglycinamidine synthase subunit PurS, partial [Candidatus Nanopelagicaceae bacterium]